ncbi:5-(carboxyamino)imidazole ribonucleotide mutase [Intestinibaculum porci]|jgi:5-(carboxyamino)imidazole ribonucleotide mutase|uniref:N5-carboxyaminoimidazole ribonucleotide mutase n=1 Tax=Intestinibaculum porci TaxID=2487118 RepID=A0A3G9J4V8_9FIRM|nr:5-(carboxyamino)imidazole ribonucleotide mutase [Intestinibaculum porci]MDD6350747.1 5-(carboxyamino)imidazole ribonucleotide mutase [Intestinibaculum porci]MDD6422954.1 5-(carboxyamino)imidazole ribonucleotide mutase [Intestinibaculum porci]BBH26207.1 N5-carboxyaminoimidazole ribonucleotide mutase [Intestinibaculum porci]
MKVAVIMGSASDADKMEACISILKDYGVDVKVRALSAHRAHAALAAFVDECNNDGTDVIITAAGMAAALPGVVASMTVLPVIGVPLKAVATDGMDALLSIVMMPSGVPVATVAINGGKNAAYLALQMMGIKYPELSEKLKAFRKSQEEACLKTNEEIKNKY